MMLFNGQKDKTINGITFNYKYEKKQLIINNIDESKVPNTDQPINRVN